MRRFYEQSLWIPQKFLFTNLDLHHGLLGFVMSAAKEIMIVEHSEQHPLNASGEVMGQAMALVRQTPPRC